jgi:hypothetical protein
MFGYEAQNGSAWQSRSLQRCKNNKEVVVLVTERGKIKINRN